MVKIRLKGNIKINKGHKFLCWYTNADLMTNKMVERLFRVNEDINRPDIKMVNEVKPTFKIKFKFNAYTCNKTTLRKVFVYEKGDYISIIERKLQRTLEDPNFYQRLELKINGVY